MIVGIGVDSIIEQIAVIVPGVGYPIHAGQAVGDVVGVGSGPGVGRLANNHITDIAQFKTISCQRNRRNLR